MRNFKAFSLIVFLAVFPSCSPSSQESFDEREITIGSRHGRVSIMAELAVTDAQRAQGLMHRTALADGKGMLFIFERDQILSFWMKNTVIPLSIAFITADGRIVEIFDMEPEDLTPIRSSHPSRFALEVPQNWFSRARIAPGDRLLIEEL